MLDQHAVNGQTLDHVENRLRLIDRLRTHQGILLALPGIVNSGSPTTTIGLITEIC
jgi:hypothetical protein